MTKPLNYTDAPLLALISAELDDPTDFFPPANANFHQRSGGRAKYSLLLVSNWAIGVG
jgi:hypothetical protein